MKLQVRAGCKVLISIDRRATPEGYLNMNVIEVVKNSDICKFGIKAAVLDFPKSCDKVIGEKVKFSGWILPEGQGGGDFSLLVESENFTQSVNFEVERPDVVERVLKAPPNDPRLKCGFKFEIDLRQEVDLFLLKDGVRVPWVQVKVNKVDEEIILKQEEILNGLMRYGADFYKSGYQYKDLKNVAGAGGRFFCESLMKRSRSLSCDQFSSSVPSEARGAADYFVDFMKNPESLGEWVFEAVKEERVSLLNPFTGERSFSNFSWRSKSNINILHFSDNECPFFVFQHVTFSDAVLFPQQGLLLIFQHLAPDSVWSALSDFFDFLIEHQSRLPKVRFFGGGLVGFGRPYHFFYDIVPALSYLNDVGLLQRLPKLYSSPHSVFVNLPELFDGVESACVGSSAWLEKDVTLSGRFVFQLGVDFKNVHKRRNDAVEYLVKKAAVKNDVSRKLPQGFSEKPVIWWGVTGQKRAWVEQIEGSAFVLNSLYKDRGNLHVVFDGWTSPIDPGETDAREIKNDEAVIERIKELLDPGIVVSSIVGAGSLTKVSMALHCDAFVANYSTGSMHVSRFAGRPGVAHISTGLNKREHIHHRAVAVPNDRVLDVVDPDNPRADFTSYSIDPMDVLFLLRSVLSVVDV